MWCPKCNSDTETQQSAAGDVQCAQCGAAQNSGRPSASSIRQARDILARWSSDDLLDRISSLPAIPPMPGATLHDRAATAESSQPDNTSESVSSEIIDETVGVGTTASNALVADPDEGTNGLVVEEEDSTRATELPAENSTASSAEMQQKVVPSTEDDHSAIVSDDTVSDADTTSVAKERSETLEERFEVADERRVEAPPQDVNDAEVAEQTPAILTMPVPDEPEMSELPQLTEEATSGEDQLDLESSWDSEWLDPEGSESQEGQSVTAAVNVASAEEIPPAIDGEESASESIGPVIPIARITAPDIDGETMETSAPSRRKQQKRRPQKRRKRLRRNLTDRSASEGINAVSRKYRVDSPGQPERDAERSPQHPGEGGAEASTIRSNSSDTGKRFRIDGGSTVQETLRTGDGRRRTDNRNHSRYIDEAHDSTLRGPHFQVTAPKRSNLTSLTGQFLAYLGVLGLTVGTAMVIYGHFGGYSDYTPTGWLVTTVAQMLLFLGVINLVSGGIEQTNDDMSARINNLGEQLLRIEQVTEEALRGPKISAHLYADPAAQDASKERESVAVRSE